MAAHMCWDRTTHFDRKLRRGVNGRKGEEVNDWAIIGKRLLRRGNVRSPTTETHPNPLKVVWF